MRYAKRSKGVNKLNIHVTHMKILIVDDSQFMREVLKGILVESGYTDIIEGADGKDGMEKIAKERPDLVLLDIVMPIMDGLEVLKQLGREMKFIVISAVGQEKMIQDSMKFGARDYIIKPFEKDKVLGAIRAVIA